MPRASQNFISASNCAKFCPHGLSRCIANPCFATFHATGMRSSFVTSTNTQSTVLSAQSSSGVMKRTPSKTLKLRSSAGVLDARSSMMPTSSKSSGSFFRLMNLPSACSWRMPHCTTRIFFLPFFGRHGTTGVARVTASTFAAGFFGSAVAQPAAANAAATPRKSRRFITSLLFLVSLSHNPRFRANVQ